MGKRTTQVQGDGRERSRGDSPRDSQQARTRGAVLRRRQENPPARGAIAAVIVGMSSLIARRGQKLGPSRRRQGQAKETGRGARGASRWPRKPRRGTSDRGEGPGGSMAGARLQRRRTCRKLRRTRVARKETRGGRSPRRLHATCVVSGWMTPERLSPRWIVGGGRMGEADARGLLAADRRCDSPSRGRAVTRRSRRPYIRDVAVGGSVHAGRGRSMVPQARRHSRSRRAVADAGKRALRRRGCHDPGHRTAAGRTLPVVPHADTPALGGAGAAAISPGRGRREDMAWAGRSRRRSVWCARSGDGARRGGPPVGSGRRTPHGRGGDGGTKACSPAARDVARAGVQTLLGTERLLTEPRQPPRVRASGHLAGRHHSRRVRG